MKRINFFLTTAVIATALFISCKKNQLTDDTKIIRGGEVALHDQSAGTALPYVTFDSLLSDSRCPINATCVWEGTAQITVTFHERAGMHTFDMSLKGYPDLGFPSDTTINGYTITFEDLKPHPVEGQPQPQTPTAVLSITR